jgi:tRNA(Ile)-lysidine synthase
MTSSTSAATWIGRVEGVLRRWLDAGLGPGWVVAVSGGSDSVGLLRVLHQIAPGLGLRLSVAHLDHGVRGEAARADAEFVGRLAEALGLPFDLGHWAPTRPGHFESDARRARYAWLAEVARARGAAAVAVGHTRDDQAETILHRIVRGTGPRGLSGMPSRRPLSDSATLVRPFLKTSRDEIRAYLAAIGQPFRDDASNADPSRTRARIRHDLLPRLAAEYNPKVADALVRLGELAAASDRAARPVLERAAREATLEIGADAVVLLNFRLARLPRPLRAEVIRLAWRRAGWPEAGMDAARWLRLAAMVRRDRGRFSIGGGIDVWLSADILRLAPAPSDPGLAPRPDPVHLPVPGSAIWGEGRVVATLDPDAPRDEVIDLDCLVAPVWVRAPVPGDRFAPLGMDGREKPLNDFFRGRRVAREHRGRVPLVCDRLGIVWVVGHRIAHRVRLTDRTTRTAVLRWEPPEGGEAAGCD